MNIYKEFLELNTTDLFNADQSQSGAGKHNRETITLCDLTYRFYITDGSI